MGFNVQFYCKFPTNFLTFTDYVDINFDVEEGEGPHEILYKKKKGTLQNQGTFSNPLINQMESQDEAEQTSWKRFSTTS